MRLLRHVYRNIGKKISGFAKLVGVLSAISFVVGIVLELMAALGNHYYLNIGAVLVVSGIGAFLFSFVLCAFGQMVHDLHRIKIIINEEYESSKSEE